MHPSPQTSESIMEYILFNPKHCIIICRQCKYALAPGERIKKHFQSVHQAISLQTRKEIIAYCERLTLLPPTDVITPNHYSKWKRLVVSKFLYGKLWVRFPTKIKTTKHTTHKTWTTTKDIYGIPDRKSLL